MLFTQHILNPLVADFADRLNSFACQNRLQEAQQMSKNKSLSRYIAPGDMHLKW